MKNFEKASNRVYSNSQSKPSEVIDLVASETPQAIKKSSMSCSDFQLAAIKKSSLLFQKPELVITTPSQANLPRPAKPDSQDRTTKFLKLERNEKQSRVKKPEETRLSSLVKMREKFSQHKSNSVQIKQFNNPQQGTSCQTLDTSQAPAEPLYLFSEELQNLTGVRSARSLSDLELALRFYLRTNSKALVNSYDFSDNEVLRSVFGSDQVKYLELKSFIELNSSLIN